MNFKYIDAHTHTQFAAYDEDRNDVIERALNAGIAMVNVGTNKETSESAVHLAEKYLGGVYVAVGIHPTHASGSSHHDKKETNLPPEELGEVFDRDFYKQLATHEKVVAIGECGLDYFRVDSEKLNVTSEKQKEVFIKHIELAHGVGKPLMIHCRSAFPDLIELLTLNIKLLNPIPGIIHFFSGTKEDAKALLELGFYFTFGGVITFLPRLAERSRGEAGVKDYDEIIKSIPIDRILSETDAPYVTPAPYRGKRNEPSYVVKVVERLADLKGVSLDEMAEQILKNARAIFPSFVA